MEMPNDEYVQLKTDIAEMKADIKYLKDDKKTIHDILEEIKNLQIQNAVMVEQMTHMQTNYQEMCKTQKEQKDAIQAINEKPLENYNKTKERVITSAISTIVTSIITYFLVKAGLK